MERRPDFYVQASTESMSRAQFREIYTNVKRVGSLAGVREAMNFGGFGVLGVEAALEEEVISSPDQFQADFFTSRFELPVELEGDTYDSARIFFRNGGDSGADKKWLGDLTFSSSQKQLQYKFMTGGRIEASRSTDGNPWTERLLVRAPQAENLLTALELIKQDLRERKLGGVALSELARRPLTTRQRVAQFLSGGLHLPKPLSA